MTRTLALDHAAEGIRVNCVLPGSVDTNLLRGAAKRRYPDDPQAAIDEWGRKHPLGRVLTAEEVAHAIVFLLSDEASGITGAHAERGRRADGAARAVGDLALLRGQAAARGGGLAAVLRRRACAGCSRRARSRSSR